MKRVLITGGSGTIGTKLTKLLQDNGYEVAWLSRSIGEKPVRRFVWDVETGTLDREAIRWCDHIIHLAGADISEKPWTKKRKQIIRDSRVKSGQMLVSALKAEEKQLSSFLSASAIGYYGSGGDAWQTEETPPADNFVSRICVDWEEAVKPVADMGTRLVIFRVGLVLTRKGGLLEPFKLPLKFGIAPYFGSGRQYYSWIHVKDLCSAFLHALQNEPMHGVYNVVAPEPIRNKRFVKELAKGMNKRALPMPVPAIALSVAMGKRGKLPFDSNRVSSQRLQEAGLKFEFTGVKEAVSNLFS